MLAAAAITLGLAAGATGVAYAASNIQNTNPIDSLVNAIATKFNLNPSDVAQVVEQQHAQMEAQHQQEYKDRLSQAVTAGTLTQEQSDKIIAKQQELRAQREALKNEFQNMTESQRHDVMQQKFEQIKQWAQDNNIPEEYMRPNMGMGHGGPTDQGFGGRPDQQ